MLLTRGTAPMLRAGVHVSSLCVWHLPLLDHAAVWRLQGTAPAALAQAVTPGVPGPQH